MIEILFIFLLLFGYTKSVCAEDADDLSVDLGSLKFQHFNIRDYASCYLLGLLNSAVTNKRCSSNNIGVFCFTSNGMKD